MFKPSRRYLRIARQCTLLACAVAYFAATFGVPMPVTVAVKSIGQPFPCQDHCCGCRSAEQCAERCCCYSRVQQKSWYAQHGIAAPAAVALATNSHSSPPGKSCCQTAGHSVQRQLEPTSTGWTLSVGASKCHGLVSFWLTAGAVLPPPAGVECCIALLPSEWLIPHNVALSSASATPPVPPPRLELI